jgi:hypothetical protein
VVVVADAVTVGLVVLVVVAVVVVVEPEPVVEIPVLELPEVLVPAAVMVVDDGLVAAFAVELAPLQADSATRAIVAMPYCNTPPFIIFCI